jgi:hypothetical protein
MKNFMVYFEVFGKKMKTKISATSAEEAKAIVLSKVIFYKVDRLPSGHDAEFLKDFFGFK